MKANVRRSTLTAAYAIAICADLIQLCFLPFLDEGFASPMDDFLDVVVCVILSRLIGFHLAFLPSFLIKIIPVVDLAPTWTVAVLIASRHLRAPPIVDVPPVVDVPTSGGGNEQNPKPPRQLK